MPHAQPVNTLFERLGGSQTVETAVGAFYFNLLNDLRVAHLFRSHDIDQLRKHQERFLTMAFGGPVNYSGPGIRAAHQNLVREHGLNSSHFDAVVENLHKTLWDLNIDHSLIFDVLETVGSFRNDVLGLTK